MNFKIRDTYIEGSFSFFAVLLIILCRGGADTALSALIFSLLHESGHIFAIKICGCNINKISLNAFGAEIVKSENSFTGYIKDIIIFLSGPLINLTAAIIILIIITNWP